MISSRSRQHKCLYGSCQTCWQAVCQHGVLASKCDETEDRIHIQSTGWFPLDKLGMQHCWYIILAQDSLEDIQCLPSIGTSTYHLGASLCHLIGVRIATGNSCGVNTYGDKWNIKYGMVMHMNPIKWYPKEVWHYFVLHVPNQTSTSQQIGKKMSISM